MESQARDNPAVEILRCLLFPFFLKFLATENARGRPLIFHNGGADFTSRYSSRINGYRPDEYIAPDLSGELRALSMTTSLSSLNKLPRECIYLRAVTRGELALIVYRKCEFTDVRVRRVSEPILKRRSELMRYIYSPLFTIEANQYVATTIHTPPQSPPLWETKVARRVRRCL